MNISGITKDSRVRNYAYFPRFGKLLVLAVPIFILVACAALPKRTPPTKTPITTKPPVSVPVRPVSTGMTLVDPGNHEQEKNRIKTLLSRSPHDSLPTADVGYYMDVLQARIKQQVAKHKGIGIARSNDRIVIVMTGSSGFEGASNKISPGIRAFLAPLSQILVEYRMTLVSIRIRADSSGGKAGNTQLTDQRAQAIAKFILDEGVLKKRVIVVGAGKSASASANTNSGGHARIELQLEPIVRSASQ